VVCRVETQLFRVDRIGAQLSLQRVAAMSRVHRESSRISAGVVALLVMWTSWPLAQVTAQTLPARMALVNAASESTASADVEPLKPPVKFRRVFVPVDAPQAWPTGGEQYLPLNRDQFEQLVAAAEGARHPGGPARPRIAEAEYRAKLGDGDVLTGTATLHIEQTMTDRRLLPLAPLSMAITGARWASALPPLIGVWAQPGSTTQQYAVAVDASDRLHLEWTAPLQSTAGQDRYYALRLPRAPAQRFVLELPPNCMASIEPGQQESKTPLGDDGSTEWTFRLPVAAEYRVRIMRTDRPDVGGVSLPLVAVAENYRLTTEGLDYEAEWRIEPRGLLSEMPFDVPAGMQVVQVEVNREPTAWRRAEIATGAATTRVTAPLPVTAKPHTVRIKAATPLILDQPWTLPTIQAADAFWSEGTAALLVDGTLELRSVDARRASLVNVLGIGGDSTGEAYRVQQSSADAEMEVVIGRRESVVGGEMGAAVEFADREIVARSTIRLNLKQGREFDLFAVIQRHWNVEAVSATPSGVLSTWHVEQSPDQRRLRLELRRWPSDGEPVVITVDGRKRTSRPIASATMDSLRWLRFPDVRMTSELLAARDRRGDRIVPASTLADDVVDVASLSADERQLLGAASGAVVLAAATADPQARVRLAARSAQFEGDARVELIRTATGFEHRADVACRPTVGAMSEALVTFAHPLPTDAAWRMDVPGGQLIVARLGDAAASVDTSPPLSPTTYRVQFGKPIAEPFHLRVAWRSERRQTDAVNAVTMPGADAWFSWAILRADPRQVRVDAHGFVPAAAQPPNYSPDLSLPVVACFRLSSDTAAPPDVTPSMESITATGSTVASTAFCRFADLVTLIGADGAEVHEASYELVARSADQATIDLPAGMEVEDVRIDGLAVAVERSAAAPRRIRVRLPRGRGEMQLVLRLRAPSLDSVAVVQPPWLGVSFEVLRGRWTVAAPPRFAFVESTTAGDPGWYARLLGPLARRGSAQQWRLPAVLGAASVSASADNLAEHRLNVPRGWATVTQAFSLAPKPVRILSVDRSQATWYACWLAAAAATVWLAGRRVAWVAMAAAAAAAGTLALPLAAASVAQGAFLGILTGLGVWAFVGGMQRTSLSGGVTQAAALPLVIAALASLSVAGVARAEGAAALPGVLIPIDADRQPQGDDVYVPAKLLAELRAAAATASVKNAAAAITSARYELTLENRAERDEVDCSRGLMVLRCETMQAGARMTLPLRKNDAEWLDAQHTLNGRPLALDWDEDGNRAVIRLPDSGSSELRLHFAPRATSLADRRQTSVHVPALPGAVVEVKHPFGLQNVAVAAAATSVHQSSAARTVARMTATDLLEISWPTIAARAAPQALNVEQLTWLHVERASAYVDVRIRLEGDAAPLEKLELATASELRLEPLGEDSPIQSIETTPGAPAVVKLNFRSLERLPLTLALRFQVQRTVSMGRFSFPTVRVLRAATRQHHFAVSAGPRLRTIDEPTSGLTPITVAEITQTWGVPSAKPLYQYAVNVDDPHWALAVEQPPSQFSAHESLDLLCQAAEASVDYVATVDELDGAVLMQNFVVSPAVRISDVVVSDRLPGEPLASRWTRPAPDRVCVFFSAPLSAAHVIRILGSVPYDDASRLPIPRMAIQRARTTTSELVVRRTSDALVSWSGEGAPAAVLPDRGNTSSSALVVGRYALPSAGSAVGVLDVVRNDVQWDADALIALDLAADEPAARVVVNASVLSGALDRVRLAASLDWEGPFEATDATTNASAIPGEGMKLIEIRLDEPITAGQQRSIRVVGKLRLAADQRIRMPQVRLLGAAGPRMFVALPPTVAGQASTWTLAGLRQEELPQGLDHTPEAETAGATYVALRDHYVAEQRVFPRMMRDPEARLTATRGAVDDDGMLSAVAELVVQPGSADRCAVRLPPSAELLAAAVNDMPVVDLRTSDGVWQTPIGLPYLPRIVTISYRQQLPAAGGGYRFDAAKAIVGGRELAAAETLWQIQSDPRRPWTAVTGGALDKDRFAAIRQRQLAAAATEASPLAFQLPLWESGAWFAPWLRRLPETADAGAPWAELRDQQDATMLPASPAAAIGSAADDPSTDNPQTTTWFQAAAGELVVKPPADWTSIGRWLAVLTIAAVVAAVLQFPEEFASIGQAVHRWPHATAALAGVFWWLALSPSALGLIIVGLSVASYLRTRVGAAERVATERGSVIATGVG
jgi:YD repeat-containing protein